jgi:hypothetical protein
MTLADPLDDHYAHLRHLTDSILRDVARNDCAPHDYRKFAVELLLVRKSPYAEHEDLREFVRELEAETGELQFEYPAPEPGPGPMVASVTTATMFSDGPLPTKEELDASRSESV